MPRAQGPSGGSPASLPLLREKGDQPAQEGGETGDVVSKLINTQRDGGYQTRLPFTRDKTPGGSVHRYTCTDRPVL